MHCDVMCCPLMWWAVICCEVMRCNGMRSYEFVMRCGWLRCHVDRFEVVVWGELEDDLVIRTTQIYSVLQSTTPVLLRTTPVRQSTTPVLFCTTKYYSSTTPYYSSTTKYYSSTILYYSSITPYYTVLLRTTKYYSSTTLYYKVLLQSYSVLQSTTPVLLRTTQYYSVLQSTTPCTTRYYKVLLQYYSVLQSTTPVLLCTTKYYSSPILYYKVLLRYYSLYYKVLICKARSTNVTKCCACHAKWLSWLILVTYETWNVIYNAQSNRTHPPTSPIAAPATQNDSHDWCPARMTRHLQCAEQQISSSNITKCCACHAKWLASSILVTYETSFTMRGATRITLQHHQIILRLPRKKSLVFDPRHIWNVIYNARSNKHHPPTSPNAAPATKNDAHHWLSSHMQRHLQCAEQQASPSNLTKYCACHAKLHSKIKEKLAENSWSVNSNKGTIRAWSDHDPSMNSSSRTRPLAEVTFRASETHFVLKITTFRAPAIYPNFTKYCACHEKWHSKITKYCACHAKWLSWLMSRTHDTSFTTRGATDLILQHHQMLRLPRKMTRIIYPRDIYETLFRMRGGTGITRQSHQILCACHAKWLSWLIFVTYETSFTMRGATGITLQPHQILRLPRKSALQNLSEILRERLKRQFQCAADSTMIRTWSEHELVISHPPVRRGSFRASETHFVLKITTFRAPAIYSNFTEYCACHEKWPSNLTKCCSCHEKWCASLTVVAYETPFTMRRATGITLQPHQILRLPRKSALQNLSEILRELVLKITTFRAPAIYSNFTEYCACHKKWHSNLTKCCSCHEKWFSWLISVTYETSFTMRGATSITLQPHQILRLPRKMTLMIDCRRMERHLQCAEQQASLSNLTKYLDGLWAC